MLKTSWKLLFCFRMFYKQLCCIHLVCVLWFQGYLRISWMSEKHSSLGFACVRVFPSSLLAHLTLVIHLIADKTLSKHLQLYLRVLNRTICDKLLTRGGPWIWQRGPKLWLIQTFKCSIAGWHNEVSLLECVVWAYFGGLEIIAKYSFSNFFWYLWFNFWWLRVRCWF